MKRTDGWVALLVLGVVLSAPTFLHARSKTKNTNLNSKHAEVPQQVQKSSKQYNKQLKKEQKREAKLQKKQAKQNKKLHPAMTTHKVT